MRPGDRVRKVSSGPFPGDDGEILSVLVSERQICPISGMACPILGARETPVGIMVRAVRHTGGYMRPVNSHKQNISLLEVRC